MTAAVNPLNLLFGLAGAVLKPFGSSKPKPVPQALPMAQTQTTTAVLDSVAARRGSQANQRTGSRGAEAGGGTKTKLGA